jgi:hypothetical protein
MTGGGEGCGDGAQARLALADRGQCFAIATASGCVCQGLPAFAPAGRLALAPTAVMVRQILGAVAQFEKATTVAKLAAARKRKREATGKCEGRKPIAEQHPEAVAMARKLAAVRKRPAAEGDADLTQGRLTAAYRVNALVKFALSSRAMLGEKSTETECRPVRDRNPFPSRPLMEWPAPPSGVVGSPELQEEESDSPPREYRRRLRGRRSDTKLRSATDVCERVTTRWPNS